MLRLEPRGTQTPYYLNSFDLLFCLSHNVMIALYFLMISFCTSQWASYLILGCVFFGGGELCSMKPNHNVEFASEMLQLCTAIIQIFTQE